MMDDPEDKKPEGYDDIPETIEDPDAEKPEDWDDESDGEWEAPMIDNPDYKGPWMHPMIANPEYVDDDKVYNFPDSGFVGFDLWQVKAGSIFDNIMVTDSVSEAEAFLKETFDGMKKAEEEDDDEDDDEDDEDDEDESGHDEL